MRLRRELVDGVLAEPRTACQACGAWAGLVAAIPTRDSHWAATVWRCPACQTRTWTHHAAERDDGHPTRPVERRKGKLVDDDKPVAHVLTSSPRRVPLDDLPGGPKALVAAAVAAGWAARAVACDRTWDDGTLDGNVLVWLRSPDGLTRGFMVWRKVISGKNAGNLAVKHGYVWGDNVALRQTNVTDFKALITC